VNSLPKTATRQRSGCDLNPGPSAPESSTLTTRLPSHPSTDEVANSGKNIRSLETDSHKPVRQLNWYRLTVLLISQIKVPGIKSKAVGTSRRKRCAFFRMANAETD